jgi:hypothetical protein
LPDSNSEISTCGATDCFAFFIIFFTLCFKTPQL